MSCIFCKIINKEAPSDIVYEDEKVIVFRDRSPQAPVHLLIAPKRHIESVVSDFSEEVIKDLVVAAKEIAKQKEFKGFKLLLNVGKEGGQTVDHLHMHLLAGKRIHKKEVLDF